MVVERLTRERRRELTRTTLLAAAAEVFAARGFHGASLDEIAETAGFTRGAIYKNFANKEDLFFAVCDNDFDLTLQSFSHKLEHDGGPLDVKGLAELWREIVGSDTDKVALCMEFRLYAMRKDEVAARFAKHQRETRRALAQFMVDEAAKAGLRITIPPETLAALLDAASWGFLESACIEPRDSVLLENFLELVLTAACTAEC